MDEWRRIESLTRKKEAEIQSLESQLSAAKAYLQALQDVLKVLPRKQMGGTQASSTLSPGGMMALAREAILRHGGPMHISQLLREIGKEASRGNRASLSGSLSAYVRKGEILPAQLLISSALSSWEGTKLRLLLSLQRVSGK